MRWTFGASCLALYRAPATRVVHSRPGARSAGIRPEKGRSEFGFGRCSLFLAPTLALQPMFYVPTGSAGSCRDLRNGMSEPHGYRTTKHVHDCDDEQHSKHGRPNGSERDGLFEGDYVFILSEPVDEWDGSVARILSFDFDGDVLVNIGGCVFAFLKGDVFKLGRATSPCCSSGLAAAP